MMQFELTVPSDAHPLGIALSAEQMHAVYVAGYQLYELGDFRRATDVFRLLALSEPLYADAWQGLGACYEQVDDHEAAARAYAAGYLLGGKVQTLGLLWARALIASDESEAAVELLDEMEAESLAPELLTLAKSLRELGGAS